MALIQRVRRPPYQPLQHVHKETTYVLPGPRFFIAFFLHLKIVKFIDLDQGSTGGLGLDFQDIPLREIATIKSKASTKVFVKHWLIVGDWRRLKMLTKP